MQVAKHKVVVFDYTLTDDNGRTLGTSDGNDPLLYLHGAGNILPGLESELEGKSAGDQLCVSLAPEEGYGQRNERLLQVVPRQSFDDMENLEVGMRFRVKGDGGDAVVKVVEIGDGTVTLDGNHDLAGVTLHFDVTVRDVRPATDEEIAHGHAHDSGEPNH